jgi:hypothetical protein
MLRGTNCDDDQTDPPSTPLNTIAPGWPVYEGDLELCIQDRRLYRALKKDCWPESQIASFEANLKRATQLRDLRVPSWPVCKQYFTAVGTLCSAIKCAYTSGP